MNTDYGRMIGCLDAIDWVESIQVSGKEKETKQYVLARMRYEFDKDRPVPPKLHKGVHGRIYDSYSCGNCGHVLSVTYKYCPTCGRKIKDCYLETKTAKEQADRY